MLTATVAVIAAIHRVNEPRAVDVGRDVLLKFVRRHPLRDTALGFLLSVERQALPTAELRGEPRSELADFRGMQLLLCLGHSTFRFRFLFRFLFSYFFYS